MATDAKLAPIGAEKLKVKQRRLRDGFPLSLTLRVHRSISWLQRAETARGDNDAMFIFLWIAFNAIYAEGVKHFPTTGERSTLDDFFQKIVALDQNGRIYEATWKKFAGPIRTIIDNKFVFAPFWQFHNGVPGNEDWSERFEKSRKRLHRALEDRDTKLILTTVFDRLYVLRNQIVHGGATWNSSVNRAQINDGAAILGFQLPIFIDIMMDNPTETWGAPHYPVIDQN